MADRQEESTSVPGYAFSGLTMSKLVTDRRAISSKTYPGTARLDMETSPESVLKSTICLYATCLDKEFGGDNTTVADCTLPEPM